MKKNFVILFLALAVIAGAVFFFSQKPDSQISRTAISAPIPISYQQVKKDPVINTVIDSSKKIGNDLEVIFHHNSAKEEPVSILGNVSYELSSSPAEAPLSGAKEDKTSAFGGEAIVLKVFNWSTEYFEIKIGANSDHFAFGKKAESLDNDEPVLKELQRQGIDKADVVLEKDYLPRSKGGSPFSKTYKDTKSGKNILVSQALPQVDEDGAPIDVSWTQQGKKFTEKNNLFKATVDGTNVELKVKNDQPFDPAQGGPAGRKKNDRLSFNAQLFLNEAEQSASEPVLLAVDPVNANYENNVLEWDYGIAKRRLRLIEGKVLGSWVFASNPNGEVRIKYNQTGDYKLKLGEFAISDDEERVTAQQFNNLTIEQYPFTVNDSATYNPDANPETTSVDGTVQRGDSVNEIWATIRAGAGTSANDSSTQSSFYVLSSPFDPSWYILRRAIFLFDTSGLPDNSVISAATISLYGVDKYDNLNIAPNVNIYTSTPASNTALQASDYGQLGSTAQSTAISYANWSVTGYNDFNLNDLTQISLTGVSKFGFQNANYDVAGIAPSWSNNTNTAVHYYSSEQGAGYQPKLVVTYTPRAVRFEGVNMEGVDIN